MLRALPALFLLPSLLFAGEIVDGRVVNVATGTGIPDVNVILFGGDEPHRIQSGPDGRFRFDDIPAGTYHPFYRARGFWTVPYSLDPRGLPPITVAATGEAVHLDGKMQPVPKVSGRVLDPEGKPVPGAAIWAIENNSGCNEASCFGFRATTQTNDRGEYTLDSFDGPGAWLVSAIPPATLPPPPSGEDRVLGWAQTFYPNVADPQLAARVPVRTGDQTSIDIRLAAVPVHRIRGHVLDAQGRPAKIMVVLDRLLSPGVRRETGSDGAFDFPSIPEGEWRLSTLRQLRNETKPWAGETIQVKNRDLENVELRMAEPFSIRGQVVWDAPEGVAVPDRIPDVLLVLQDAGDGPTPPGEMDDNGALVFKGIYPGRHKVLFLEPPPPPFYLDSVRYGNQDAASSPVTILSAEQPIAITFRYGGGTVSGTIEGCGTAQVLLIPFDSALRSPAFVHSTRCGPNGQFDFAGVRPGDYYGVAILKSENDATWWTAAQDEAVLRRAARVTVRSNEHSTAEIRLIRQ